MGFFSATILFLIGFITIVVLLPAYNEIVGTMNGVLPVSVTLMVSSMILLIVVGLFVRYIYDAGQPGHMGDMDPAIGDRSF